MSAPQTLILYLEESLLRSARRGEHNFISKVAAVMQASGYDVSYLPETVRTEIQARRHKGYSMFHMKPPVNERGLMFRRAYHYPFWAIEPVAERWNWSVAGTAFDPDSVPEKEARQFYARWQSRLFGEAPQTPTSEGFIYVPLQGMLRVHRSFQSCSPMSMIEAILKHDPTRQVIATLHPKEVYSEADIAALHLLETMHSSFELRAGGMEELLQGCDYVVTQNSSAAFDGFFFGKPAILFGQIDFHHIAASVHRLGLAGAFDAVHTITPDYAKYIHWYWQTMSINAGHPSAEQKIKAAVSRAGWPM
jgi:hypothetical protein